MKDNIMSAFLKLINGGFRYGVIKTLFIRMGKNNRNFHIKLNLCRTGEQETHSIFSAGKNPPEQIVFL